MPALYVMHGPALGGSAVPDGVWTEMAEDDKGLKVKGRISALDTDHGKRIRSLVQDGALKGLSVGFQLGGSDNFIRGKAAGEPKRQIKNLAHLVEVSL
jgi:HK97 family phage prohead protease